MTTRAIVVSGLLLAAMSGTASRRSKDAGARSEATDTTVASRAALTEPSSDPSSEPASDLTGAMDSRWTNSKRIHDAPLDDSSRLVVQYRHERYGLSSLRVLLIDRADSARAWVIESIEDTGEYFYEARRVRRTSLVVCRPTEKSGDGGCFKLFFDPVARRALKRVEFARGPSLAFRDAIDATRVLGLSEAELGDLSRRGLFDPPSGDAIALPALFTAHPLPKTSYAEFARTRPGRVKNGYTEEHTSLEDRVGAWQADTGGYWFAKVFYDGEGTSGVGRVGFLSDAGAYSFLDIPQLYGASASALLVTDDAIWVGLQDEAEYGTYPGGLLRFDRRTKQAFIRPIEDLIHRIIAIGAKVFVRTSDGVYVLDGSTFVWHGMEPDMDGRLVVVTDTISR